MSELKPLVLNPPLNVQKVTNEEGIEALLSFLEAQSKFPDTATGFDVETTPTNDYYWRRMRTVQFGNQKSQFVVDLLELCDGDSDLLYKCQGEYGKHLHLAPRLEAFINQLKPYLTERRLLLTGVSLSFEYMCFYWLFGVRIQGLSDCAITERCIVAGYHSLKDYSYFSMASMMERYFFMEVDKSLQTSFTLDGELTDAQYGYAALDTRLPLAIRSVQQLITGGHTYKSLKAKGSKAAERLKDIDPVLTGDNLTEIVQIEQDAIGAFVDMNLHGERIDRDRWNARVAKSEQELKTLISDVLDPIFIPVVGTKSKVITDQDIEEAQAKWKAFNTVPDAELKLKAEIRYALKKDPFAAPDLQLALEALDAARKSEKEKYKKIASEIGKQRTKIKNLVEKCEGQALINYGSDAQLLAVIKTFKGLGRITGLDDETLEKHAGKSVMDAVRKYHGLKKEIGTYGYAWTTEWKTKPSKEEGWLHPGDGRLHCTFNQYDAETGRSSSSTPNAQNLPQDKEVRMCFVADPPDESVRISTCCGADTYKKPLIHELYCKGCNTMCIDKPEEWSLITIDMAGAELRILAEEAKDPIWINAFNRGEDVHSVCTELVEPDKWPLLALPGCAYYKIGQDGNPERKKCKCPEHNELRNGMKPTNFGLPYGIGPRKLAGQIKKSEDETIALLNNHRKSFPNIWTYLEQSALRAKIEGKSFDMFGRRRLFPAPTWEAAKKQVMEYYEDRLRLEDDVAAQNIAQFVTIKGREPDKEEKVFLTHRQPNNKEIGKAMMGMAGSIERQGKNHRIQSANSTIIKAAMGSGTDPNGEPFLWHVFPKYKARLLAMIHDELKIAVPTRFAQELAGLIQSAFRRAAALRMSLVQMESEFHIGPCWEK